MVFGIGGVCGGGGHETTACVQKDSRRTDLYFESVISRGHGPSQPAADQPTVLFVQAINPHHLTKLSHITFLYSLNLLLSKLPSSSSCTVMPRNWVINIQNCMNYSKTTKKEKKHWNIPQAFKYWIVKHNYFCICIITHSVIH